ncbi:MAG: preprotein translocase subunit SecE [Candidatus Acetothermia bacterium]|jgi:preprotein translocase subunit SecE|nr:preprotein translocase subunit SecE [Candidatus Acetothermia bacterium]
MTVTQRIRKYMASVRGEVQRVSWPARREVISLTVLILLLVVALAIYLGAVDAIFQQILRLLLKR